MFDSRLSRPPCKPVSVFHRARLAKTLRELVGERLSARNARTGVSEKHAPAVWWTTRGERRRRPRHYRDGALKAGSRPVQLAHPMVSASSAGHDLFRVLLAFNHKLRMMMEGCCVCTMRHSQRNAGSLCSLPSEIGSRMSASTAPARHSAVMANLFHPSDTVPHLVSRIPTALAGVAFL